MLATTSQEKYEDKMTSAGMYKMSVWIPEHERDKLSKYAKSLRAKHLNQTKREAKDADKR